MLQKLFWGFLSAKEAYPFQKSYPKRTFFKVIIRSFFLPNETTFWNQDRNNIETCFWPSNALYRNDGVTKGAWTLGGGDIFQNTIPGVAQLEPHRNSPKSRSSSEVQSQCTVWKTKHSTCSGLRPGGTHVYSSSAHPLSSSDVELRWASCVRRCRLRSPSLFMSTSWHSRGHLQCRQIFLQVQKFEKDMKCGVFPPHTTWNFPNSVTNSFQNSKDNCFASMKKRIPNASSYCGQFL